jgi:hypothetical protein
MGEVTVGKNSFEENGFIPIIVGFPALWDDIRDYGHFIGPVAQLVGDSTKSSTYLSKNDYQSNGAISPSSFLFRMDWIRALENIAQQFVRKVHDGGCRRLKRHGGKRNDGRGNGENCLLKF